MFSSPVYTRIRTRVCQLSSLITVHQHHPNISAVRIFPAPAHDDVDSALNSFDAMPQKSSSVYNSLIAEYSHRGLARRAWALLARMLSSGLRPTPFTFGAILSSKSFDPSLALLLHPLILKAGLLHSEPFSGTALLCLFTRHGSLDVAFKLFDEMPIRTVVTWNVLIHGLSRRGYAGDSMVSFRELMRSRIGLSEFSFISILSAFRAPHWWWCVEQVQGIVHKTSMDYFVVVVNALLDAYSGCIGVYEAEKLFTELPIKDIVTWNTVIGAFAKSGTPEKALELFLAMQFEGFHPNETTFSSVLVCCIGMKVPAYGELIHAKAIKHNLQNSLFLGSSLVDFYAKFKSMVDALMMFNEIPEKNVVSWNTLISAYSNEGCNASVALLKEMLDSGITPSEFSFSSGLKCVSLLDLQQLHSVIVKMGYGCNEYVSSAITASYVSHGVVSNASSCHYASDEPANVVTTNIIAGVSNREGRYKETKKLFSQVQDMDTVSWNILLTACARNGDYLEAFELFKKMQTSGYLIDNFTVVSLLSICSKIDSLVLGSLLHGLIIKTNSGLLEVFVNNVLLDMYAKCGSLESSWRVFEEMPERNLISWTACIAGLGLHGCTHDALKKFQQMELEGFKPDRVAFLAVLSACRHSGLVEEGLSLFRRMKDVYGVDPEMDHYICVVDLLCKYGHLKDAEVVISSMPFQPNAVIWRTFLQGCKRHGSSLTEL